MRIKDYIISKALELLKLYPLCDSCLGRQFALLGYGLENKERGYAIKTLLLMEIAYPTSSLTDAELIRLLARTGFRPALDLAEKLGINVKVEPCFLCENKLDTLEELASKICRELRKIDFSSFLVGSLVPARILKREEELRVRHNLEFSESIKREINRRIGKIIQSNLGKQVEFKRPDLLVLVDIGSFTFTVEIFPIYVAGNYRKLTRSLPQSRWPCRECSGKGCLRCGYRGKLRSLSIEELIGTIILKYFQAESAILHATGREDIDARMLGTGRPFVIEVRRPLVRRVDLKRLEIELNSSFKGILEVFNLRFVEPDLARYIKLSSSARRKLYRAMIEVGRELKVSDLERLEKTLEGRIIYQRTPLRVVHRRKDIVREKKVYEFKVIAQPRPNSLIALILAQGGLYIKELVSGDQGRTTPSVSDIVNSEARCTVLDVMGVES